MQGSREPGTIWDLGIFSTRENLPAPRICSPEETYLCHILKSGHKSGLRCHRLSWPTGGGGEKLCGLGARNAGVEGAVLPGSADARLWDPGRTQDAHFDPNIRRTTSHCLLRPRWGEGGKDTLTMRIIHPAIDTHTSLAVLTWRPHSEAPHQTKALVRRVRPSPGNPKGRSLWPSSACNVPPKQDPSLLLDGTPPQVRAWNPKRPFD